MRNLIDFLLQRKHWFLFLLLEGVCLITLFNQTGYQKSVFFSTANYVVGSAYSVVSSVTSYINLQEENKMLEKENEDLRMEVISLRSQIEQNQIDSLSAKHSPWMQKRYELIDALVVNSTLHRSNNLLTINKGSADGIRPEMGVVSSHGVVGVVYMTSSHYSLVMPLLNTNSRISCRLRGSEHFGTLQWKQGRADITYITGIPLHAKYRKNEVIETNGYSDIFPAGIPVGYVMSSETSANGLFYNLKVGLFTNFKTLRNVSIITNYTNSEKRMLEQQADSLEAK